MIVVLCLVEKTNGRMKKMSLNIYDEHYEFVELFGKPALFSNARIDRETVPDGVYVYDLRHGDSGRPLTVEPFVGVNHAGTVIMTEPLDFSKQEKKNGDKYLNIRNRLNFLGECRTFEEFMEETAAQLNSPEPRAIPDEEAALFDGHDEAQGMTMGRM